MSEQIDEVAATTSAGALLRQAREAAGMSIEALASALKVPVSKVAALEANEFSGFANTVFVRGLASSVCRVLKVDATPILALMPQGETPQLPQRQEGINAPFRSEFSGHSALSRGTSQLKNPVALAVAALLVGALVLVFLPRNSAEESTAAADEGAPVAQPMPVEQTSAVVAQAPASQPAVVAPPAPEMAKPVASKPTAAASAVVPTKPAPPPLPVASAAVAAPASSVSAPSSAVASTPSAAGVLVFQARESSWVQVRDASGASIFQRMLVAGEQIALPASGRLPWSVVVGRADATQVYVRGNALNMLAIAKDNVARFEVK